MMKKMKLAEFFGTEYRKLAGYVRRFIDDSADRDAEDIVQDVIVNLFDKADVTIPIENLAAYVYRSLQNKIVDIFRSKKKSHHISLDTETANGSSLSLAGLIRDTRRHTESEAEQNELYAHLYEAIESLTPPEQAVIIATEFDGVSFGRLAEEWDVPIGTLLARKARAIRKIKQKITGG